MRHAASIIASLLSAVTTSPATAEPYVPVRWTTFVPVAGQSEPVPEQWLQDEEARIAHSLKLPAAVPKPVPFDFKAAWWRSWLPKTGNVALQYFDHLCRTEAGEWIFKKVHNVEGLYFARPQGAPSSDMLKDPYGPEMPWMQRLFVLLGDAKPLDQAQWLIEPPLYNYRFVEQPRRDVKWQAGISEPYVRLHGYTREAVPVPGVFGKAYDKNSWYSYRDKTPMRVDGIPEPTARYGYTWRGLKRTEDREHGIAGGEVLIYDLITKEVLAARRQFVITARNPRGAGKAVWEVAARCPQIRAGLDTGEFSQFAFDVLETIEPSTTGRK
jgi:hypothetical protein